VQLRQVDLTTDSRGLVRDRVLSGGGDRDRPFGGFDGTVRPACSEVAPAENTTGNESPNGSSAPHPRVDIFGAPLEVSVFAAADRDEGGHGDVRIAINVGGLGRSRARNEHLLVASRAYRRSNDPDACDETMRTGPSWMTNSRR